jgi:hypothetical protein
MEYTAYTGCRAFDYRLGIKTLNNTIEQPKEEILPAMPPRSNLAAMKEVYLASPYFPTPYR